MRVCSGHISAIGSGLLAVLVLTGCASAPPRSTSEATATPVQTVGEQLALGALSQLGRPYLHGGEGPEGFDCSGLVRYVHNALGITTPRTTRRQFESATPVEDADLASGDLLFFRIGGRAVSHVAIYVGDGRFVHAPRTGRPVEVRPMSDAYFRTRLVRIGRLR